MNRNWLKITVSAGLLAAALTGCAAGGDAAPKPAATTAPATAIEPPRIVEGDPVLTATENTFSGAQPLDFTPFRAALDAVPEKRLDEVTSAIQSKSLTELRAARARLHITAEEMVLATVRMIEKTEYYRPVMQLDPTALDQARRVDARAASGPLAGMVFLVKGNIAVAGLRSDAGSAALADSIATTDAPAVARLRDAGAIVLGRSNLSELAYSLSSKAPSGFSAMGGQTLAPDGPLTVDPQGSSTGSAVAVQLGLVPFALGTETMGSIVAPAETAGVVGFRASTSGWPRDGIVPLDSAWDAAGVLARSVEDAIEVDAAVTAAPAAQPARRAVILDTADPAAQETVEAAGVETVEADARLRSAMDAASAGLANLALFNCGYAQSLTPYLAANTEVADMRALDDWYASHATLAPYGFDAVTAAAQDTTSPADCAALHAAAAQSVDAVGEELKRLDAQIIVGDNGSTGFVVYNGSPRMLVPTPGGSVLMNGVTPDDGPMLLATANAITSAP